jgi:hypothetical protein
VVEAKPIHDSVKYSPALPLNRIPSQFRTDKFNLVGTAFSLGNDRYVTAAHVLLTGLESLWGLPELRDSQGHIYKIDKIYKFSMRKDFVVFSLIDGPKIESGLQANLAPTTGESVYAVGDANGNGIVIQAGSYAFTTQEPPKRTWKWVRFTSPIYPGDSGGPLVDKDAKVIGVVLYKSKNGSPNYALPIKNVINAPADSAEIDVNTPYHFDLFQATTMGVFNPFIKLPVPLIVFYKQFDASLHRYWNDQLKDLLFENRSDIFPKGSGSNAVLYSVAWSKSLPAFLTRDSSGIWAPEVHPRVKLELPDNSYLELGNVGDNVLFHLKKSTKIPDRIYFHEPPKVMDALLRPGTVWRVVAGQRVKVTSLGKPEQASVFTDVLHRRWQIWTWPIPFSNSRLIVFALPVPNGYVGFFRALPAGRKYNFLINMKAMTTFFCTAYEGTLAQWKDYLSTSSLVPSVLHHVRITLNDDDGLSYDSRYLKFLIKPSVMEVSEKSDLTLGIGYDLNDYNKLNVTYIFLQDKLGRDSIRIERHVNPLNSSSDAAVRKWQHIMDREYQFNEVSRINGGKSEISSVKVPDCSGETWHCGRSRVLYTIDVVDRPNEPIKSELIQFEKNFYARRRL